MKRPISSSCLRLVPMMALFALCPVWMMPQQPNISPPAAKGPALPASLDNFLARPASQSKSPAYNPATLNETAPILSQQTPIPVAPRWFILIDAGHGGADPGAHLSEKITEKDFTLQLARKLRIELQNHGIAAQLLRDNDTGLSLEQRARAANTQHAGIYISLHATIAGGGVHVFTALLPPVGPFPTPQDLEKERMLGPFIPWETSQRSQIEHSHLLALEICSQLKLHDISQSFNTAAIVPLVQLDMPAILVEVSPPAAGDSFEKLAATAYQQSIVQSIVAALSALRSRTEVAP